MRKELITALMAIISGIAYMLTNEIVALAIYFALTLLVAVLIVRWQNIIREYTEYAIQLKKQIRQFLPPEWQEVIDKWIAVEQALVQGHDVRKILPLK